MSEMQSLPADRYLKYLDQTQAALQTTLEQYSGYKAEYHELQQTLVDLPKEIEHEAMIPLGPLAFYPGKLIHTNEILVMLGDNWFVEQSATQAAEIAQRREALVDSKIEELRRRLAALKERRGLLGKSQVGGEFGGDILNEEGEPIMDIKEQLAESQLPGLEDGTEPEGLAQTEDQAREMEEKRQRLIESLQSEADISVLDPETRAILEQLEQIGSEASSDSESTEDSEEGDAFSDEDRLNAARDDDEDDYNDAHLRPSEPPGVESGPKSILKPSQPPQSLFRSRRNPPREPRGRKSVSFGEEHAEAGEEHAEAGQEHLGDLAKRFEELGSVPRPLQEAPAGSRPRFKPNVKAAGVRSQASGSRPKAAAPGAQPASQPLRAQVVEREAAAAAAADAPDADEDLHAREIALKYRRMRQARLASGVLEGAADIAEQVLAAVPGVTLVDAPGSAQGDERIELPGGPAGQAFAEVPEVVAAGSRDSSAKPRMSRFKAQRLGTIN
ncbi:hypothetical protein LPJ68_001511 [Coemansia sp. RSA 1086]|nr:hypothetical protein LPJ68_001511 [Coemansia sp. RSA 1086]